MLNLGHLQNPYQTTQFSEITILRFVWLQNSSTIQNRTYVFSNQKSASKTVKNTTPSSLRIKGSFERARFRKKACRFAFTRRDQVANTPLWEARLAWEELTVHVTFHRKHSLESGSKFGESDRRRNKKRIDLTRQSVLFSPFSAHVANRLIHLRW